MGDGFLALLGAVLGFGVLIVMAAFVDVWIDTLKEKVKVKEKDDD